ncbi:MAG: hypothetical protein KJN90_04785 [Gammaproteobacteria bacterium]|nr:hypothetical protein [Gammaproteobacteria bacterium]
MLAIVFVLPSLALGTSIIAPLTGAYSIALSNYLTGRHLKTLANLRAVVGLEDTQFQHQAYCLAHYRSLHMYIAAAFSLPVFLLVSWPAEELQSVLQGSAAPDVAFTWWMAVSILSWAAILQSIVIIFNNLARFARLARRYAIVNLLDTDELIPFTRIAISSVLLFSGPYAVLPFAILNDPSLFQPVLVSLILIIPAAIFFLTMPIVAIRNRIREVKRREVALVTQAIQGNREMLKEAQLADDPDSVALSTLFLYKETVQTVKEWPFDNSGLVKVFAYIVIPVTAWFADNFLSSLVNIPL